MKTPPMTQDKEAWLNHNIQKAIYDGCTIPTAAERLGISRETAAKYYMKIMVACSVPAIHPILQKVRVFSDKRSHWFILHPDIDRIIGHQKLDYDEWKCPPNLEDLEKVKVF